MSDEPRDRSTDKSLEADEAATTSRAEPAATDPNDEVPVPVAMFPAEVDERAQVVETLRERKRQATVPAPPAEPPAA